MINTDFHPFPVLTTQRLLLREMGHEDEAEIFFLRSDREVMKYTGQSLATTMPEITEYIRKHKETTRKGAGIIWGISQRSAPELIGLIAYRRFYNEHYRGETGYGLHPAWQGKGIMQEALEAVIAFGFNKIGLHSIEANVDKANAASIRLLERNGFVKEAHFKENYYFEGKFIDSVIYSLLAPF